MFTKEAIRQNISTIFCNTKITKDEISRVLEETGFNFEESLKKLSVLSAKKQFPDKYTLSSADCFFERNSKPENEIESYESFAHFISVKQSVTPTDQKKHALSLIGMSYMGITQILFRKFASLLSDIPFGFTFTIGDLNKHFDGNNEKRNFMVQYVKQFCEQICEMKNYNFDPNKGIIKFDVENFNPSFRSKVKEE